MQKSYRLLLTLLTALLTLALATAIQAQDETSTDLPVYYIAVDAEGVQQVYQHLLDGQSEPRQLTHATSNIINFGVAYDGLSVAYLTSNQLWLQPLHTEEAEALAPITATQFLSGPVFSPDGQYVAYTDNGIWLLDLSTRVSHQILENVDLEEGATNAREFRIYQPKKFLLNEGGKAAKLLVDVGVWEWNTDGIYDLVTRELQEFAPHEHVHGALLPLSDGRVLLYGNNGFAGEFALHMADSIDDINTYTKVLDFSEVVNGTLWADQAVEIAPGVVRIYGPGIGGTSESPTVLYFDYDVNADTASEVQFVELSGDATQMTISGPLSPDATLVPIYYNATFDGMGSVAGALSLVDLATGEAIAADVPASVSAFHWQE